MYRALELERPRETRAPDLATWGSSRTLHWLLHHTQSDLRPVVVVDELDVVVETRNLGSTGFDTVVESVIGDGRNRAVEVCRLRWRWSIWIGSDGHIWRRTGAAWAQGEYWEDWI